MNEMETTSEELAKVDTAPTPPTPQSPVSGQPPPDAKTMRTSHIGQLLGEAYKGASTLKINKQEQKDLRADFPDEAAEIVRERFIRSDTNEVAVDLVLMIRGVFIAEGVGTAKYYPNNPKASFGDTVEAAWSDAIRRCCKKFGVGTQVWRPQYVRDWLAQYAGQRDGKYFRRRPEAGAPAKPKSKTSREYTLKSEPELPPTKEDDEDDIPF